MSEFDGCWYVPFGARDVVRMLNDPGMLTVGLPVGEAGFCNLDMFNGLDQARGECDRITKKCLVESFE